MSAVRICGGEVVGYAFIPNVGNPDRQFRYAHLSTSADGSMRFQGRPGEVLTVTASNITPTGFQGTVIAPNGNRFSGPFRFKDADQC
jgi:hypothetical protein